MGDTDAVLFGVLLGLFYVASAVITFLVHEAHSEDFARARQNRFPRSVLVGVQCLLNFFLGLLFWAAVIYRPH